jgi:threonine/homoserine/homoserine lactone efflux protein
MDLFEQLSIFYRGLALGLLIAMPVGPIGLLCIRRTIHTGFLVGLATGIGAACADTFFGALAAFSVAAIVEFLRHFHYVIRFVGGFLLLGIAWHTWHAPPRPPERDVSASGVLRALASSFIITLTNPLTMFAILAVVATFGGLHRTRDAFMLIAGIFGGSVIWWTILSSGVSLLRGHFTENRVMVINRTTGIGIAVLAVGAVVSSVIGFLGYKTFLP